MRRMRMLQKLDPSQLIYCVWKILLCVEIIMIDDTCDQTRAKQNNERQRKQGATAKQGTRSDSETWKETMSDSETRNKKRQ